MKRQNPEAAIQIAVKQMLTFRLPDDVFWTASMTGQHLSIGAADRQRSLGVKRGLPDLVFMPPDGIARWVEMKAPGGSLKPEQKAFRDLCKASGLDVWELCRSPEDVADAITRWGIVLKPDPWRSREA